jgi:tRNA (guanine37-N1)-methyltransferase
MTFHVLTIFPDFFRGPLEHGVVARAAKSGKLRIRIHDLRDWTFDFHKTVDDRPFGGGEGMLMKPEPVFLAVESILPRRGLEQRVLLTSAQGPLFDQRSAKRLSKFEEVVLICGRYEGVDERVARFLADEEVSIGPYVLSGGELAAAVVIDAVARLLPGVLGNEDSARQESYSGEEGDLLDYPHYTRPADFRGMRAPDVLLGGNHEAIRRWRREAALDKTRRVRPQRLDLNEEEEDGRR